MSVSAWRAMLNRERVVNGEKASFSLKIDGGECEGMMGKPLPAIPDNFRLFFQFVGVGEQYGDGMGLNWSREGKTGWVPVRGIEVRSDIMQKIFNDTYSVREKEERFLKHIWSDNVQPSKMRLTEPQSSHPKAHATPAPQPLASMSTTSKPTSTTVDLARPTPQDAVEDIFGEEEPAVGAGHCFFDVLGMGEGLPGPPEERAMLMREAICGAGSQLDVAVVDGRRLAG